MVNYIEYQGKELPLKTNYGVISTVCAKLKIGFKEFDSISNDPSQFLILFKEALLEGHKIKGLVCQIKDEEFKDVLSDNFADFIEVFEKDCRAMQMTKKQRALEEESKKKNS